MRGRESFSALLARVRACRVCADHLPLGPRPILQAEPTARLLICGQAPGTKVHATGVPWNDPSGERLRAWLGLECEVFYDPRRVALIGVGLCYPGRLPQGGDAPPRPECAPLWHPTLRAALPELSLTLLVGSYAQAYYLGRRRKASVSETVRAYRDYLPEFIPTPHPSWRTRGWLARNPWFEAELVPELRARVRALV
jgi:uracil-DNA glycosylase